MTNPTFTALSVVLGGDTANPINASLSSTTFTLKVPYVKKELLRNAAVSLTASAANTYFFTSQETGATSTTKIGTTATSAGSFDLSSGMDIAASAAGTLTADNHSDYDVVVILVDRIESINNFAVGLGNVIAYDITKFQYSSNATTGGIPLKLCGPVFGVISVSMVRDDGAEAGGPYLWFFDKKAQKLRLFSAVNTEINGVSVGGTVLLLKQ